MYLKRRVETSDAFIYFPVRSETIRNGVGKGARWGHSQNFSLLH